jgi:hypothetical protein
MAAEAPILSPRERLALSREALVEQFHGDRPRRGGSGRPRAEPGFPRPRNFAAGDARQPLAADPDAPSPSQRAAASGRFDRFAWRSLGRGVLRRWWRRHPANAVGQLALPVLERYAREEPAKLVAASAATGALLVLTRPWRLLSATTLLALMLKSSDVADLVTTLIQNNANPRKETPP